MWSEDARSVVPALPPISATPRTSPSRHSQSSVALGYKTHPHNDRRSSSHTNGTSWLHSVEGVEQRSSVAAAGKLELSPLQLQVTELFTELGRMRAVVGHLEAERASQDIWLKESFGHISDQFSWLSQKMNDSLTKLSNKMEQLEQWASTEHAQLKADLASAAEQSRNGVWEFGNKMKDAIEEHISGLEKAFHKECGSQLSYTTQVDNKLCRQIENVQTQVDVMKDSIEKERVKYGSQFSGLSSSLSAVARSCKLSNEELSSVLNAEIKTRQSETAKVQSTSQKVHSLCRSSIGSIREGLLSLEERFVADKREVHLQNNKLLKEWQGMSERLQADVTARVRALHNHISSVTSSHQLPRGSDKSSQSTAHVEADRVVAPLREKKLETDVTGQSEDVHNTNKLLLTGKLSSLEEEVEKQSVRLNKLSSSLQDFQVWVSGALQRETGERYQGDFELKQDIVNLRTQLSMAFSALNGTPRNTNDNTQHVQLSQIANYPRPALQPQVRPQIPHHLQMYFAGAQSHEDVTSQHPLCYDVRQEDSVPAPAVDTNGLPERPAGVTTTACSPFPDIEGERGQYDVSDGESETATESEDDDSLLERRRNFHKSATLCQSPLLQQQVALVTSSDPLETSLESHMYMYSRQSSNSEIPQFQRHHVGDFPSSGKIQDSLMNQDDPDSSEHERFTSVSVTPDSQQKILVTDRETQKSDSREAEKKHSKVERINKANSEVGERAQVTDKRSSGLLCNTDFSKSDLPTADYEDKNSLDPKDSIATDDLVNKQS